MRDYDPRFTDHPFPKHALKWPYVFALCIAAVVFADVVSDALMTPGIEIEETDHGKF